MNNTLRFNPHLRLHHHNKVGAAAIFTGRHLHHITAVFRAVEILLFLAVFSKVFLMLPFALQLSGDYFRDLAVTVVSPHFVFVVGNVIVIILFVKSGGRLSHPNHSPEIPSNVAPSPEKSTTLTVRVYSSGKPTPAKRSSPKAEMKINSYRRSKSEKMFVTPTTEKKSSACVQGAVELRRTKTEKMERQVICGRKERYPEDHMSSEEFRRTIEDFIARQQRFLRKEEEEEETLAVAG